MAISSGTQKMLWARSHDVCAFVPCIQALTMDASDGVGGSVALGEQAHIRSPKPGGPRHDPHYSGDVDGFENLILLCPTHHSLVDADKGRNFTVSQLEQMKAQHGRQQQKRTAFAPAIRAYISDRYGDENLVQFRQAELQGQVDAMFVDVPIGTRTDAPAAGLMHRIARGHRGDPSPVDVGRGLIVVGAAQALLHPEWRESAVIVGGPGQGKSTLLQYLAQYYRARRLGLTAYDAQDKNLLRHSGPQRIPIRIDLRRYAKWARAEQDRALKTDGDRMAARKDLERYLLREIASRTGAYDFAIDDFEAMFSTEPVLLALDGLDEIPNVEDREFITIEIARARDRLTAMAADLVVLVSTRPGSALTALTDTRAFSILQLRPLTPGLRRQYLEKWIRVSAATAERAAGLRESFHENEHLPHIQELASSPMQLAILLNLLYRRQLLPEQRTELFRDYLVTFLDREQTEDKEPLLAEHRAVLEATHAYLGWYLHSQTELGTVEGGVSRAELRRLLRGFLAGQPDAQALADSIYSAIAERVLCLVERDGKFEFEVQSLREFFAATHIFENLTSRGITNSRDDGATALLARPYWVNVARFYVGMFTKGEVRSLRDNLSAAQSVIDPHPLVRATAVLLLKDRVFQGQATDVVAGAVDFILDGAGVALGQMGLLDGAEAPLTLGERVGRAEAVMHLRRRLELDEGPLNDVAASLHYHSNDDDDLAAWWWTRYEPTPKWLTIAAHLQALSQLDCESEDRLFVALQAVSADGGSVASLLVRGGYDGDDDRVMRLVIAEQNRGLVARALGRSSSVALLGRCAGVIISRKSMRLPDLPETASRTSRAAHIATKAFLNRGEDFFPALTRIAKVWGDGWVLRAAVAGLPATVDLQTAAMPASELQDALRAEADFRAHAGDEHWWRHAISSAASPVERNLRVVGLLSHARLAIVVALIDDLEAAVRAMTRRDYAAVSLTLISSHGPARGRLLSLGEPVRTQRIQPSGPVLWLLRAVATESGKERIDKRLEPVLASVVSAGIDVAELFGAVRVARTRRISLDVVKSGSRSHLPQSVQLESIKTGRAKEILASPDRWPVDVVQSAIDQIASSLGRQIPPLALIATRDGWELD